MGKPVVAVGIDDVLSQSAEGFVVYSNATWQSGIIALFSGNYKWNAALSLPKSMRRIHN